MAAWPTILFGAAFFSIPAAFQNSGPIWLTGLLLSSFLIRTIQFYSGNLYLFIGARDDAQKPTATPINSAVALLQGFGFGLVGQLLFDAAQFLQAMAVFLILDASWLVANQGWLIYRSFERHPLCDGAEGGPLFGLAFRKTRAFPWLPLKWAINNLGAGSLLLLVVGSDLPAGPLLQITLGAVLLLLNGLVDHLWTGQTYLKAGIR